MSGSDRSLVAPAIFGLIVTVAGLSSWATVSFSGADKPEAYRSYTERSANKPEGAEPATVESSVQTVEKRYPCRDERSRDDSDLCAQWRAAEAARNAATWAFWQLLLSVAGVIGLGLTLWFNWKALRVASEANAETRRIGEAQVRAHVAISKVIIAKYLSSVTTFEITVNNSGQSIAHMERIKWRSVCATKEELLMPLPEQWHELPCTDIIAGSSKYTIPAMPIKSGITPASILVLQIALFYTDIFGVRQCACQVMCMPTDQLGDVAVEMLPLSSFIAGVSTERVRRGID